MTWQHLEKIFNRSISSVFCREKFFLTFPLLAICGLLVIICRLISIDATEWVIMSSAFFPIFLCAGLILALGLVLIRVYHKEIKGLKVSYIQMIKEAKNLYLGIPYLSVPLLFAYIILWIVLGLFYLIRAIPHIGPFLSSILSFGPFLLVLGSLFLGIVNLLTLFFVTPAAALSSDFRPKLAEKVFREVKQNLFLSITMLLIGLLPLLFVIGFLTLSIALTQILYLGGGGLFFIALKWLFMMLPFCFLITPAVIFFFNFAAEAHVVLQQSLQNEKTA